jgi:WD40 repeat protein
VRYDPHDFYLAVGSEDGHVRILNSKKLELDTNLLDESEEKITPCTCVRWHPFEQNTLVSTYTSGSVILWKSDTGKILNKFQEPQLNISGCDINGSGEKLVTCGYDTIVRVYDLNGA